MQTHTPTAQQRNRRLACGLMLWALCATPALAHGSNKGGLRVTHAYALTGPVQAAPAGELAIYFRNIRNDTAQPERLLGASTPLATSVEIQRTLAQGSSRNAYTVASMELPPAGNIPMRHNQGAYRLLLKGLKQPPKDGDRFDLTLEFERAGKLVVNVWVQSSGAQEEHAH